MASHLCTYTTLNSKPRMYLCLCQWTPSWTHVIRVDDQWPPQRRPSGQLRLGPLRVWVHVLNKNGGGRAALNTSGGVNGLGCCFACLTCLFDRLFALVCLLACLTVWLLYGLFTITNHCDWAFGRLKREVTWRHSRSACGWVLSTVMQTYARKFLEALNE